MSHPFLRISLVDNDWEEIIQILCGHYAIGDYRKFTIINFPHSAIATKSLLPVVRWSDYDAIQLDPLLISITNLTYLIETNLT
jgi:hypothetical protein